METLDDYLTRLASDSPTPGGGSAATIVAAAGASLVAMVARICSISPKYAPFKGELDEIVGRADALRAELKAAGEHDERAFAGVVAATALPKDDPSRATTLEAALTGAAQSPLEAIVLAVDVARLATTLLDIPNRNLASDIGCAAEFAAAAVAAGAYNVRINHRFMRDETTISRQAQALASYEAEASALVDRIRAAVGTLLAR